MVILLTESLVACYPGSPTTLYSTLRRCFDIGLCGFERSQQAWGLSISVLRPRYLPLSPSGPMSLMPTP